MADRSHPQRKSHRLPAEVYALTGYEFFFTVCARHQGEPFRDERIAKIVIDSLLWTYRKYRWQLFCYCLMPDHLHFVCSLTEGTRVRSNAGARGLQPLGVLDHVARFKSYTTNQSWPLGYRGQLWQRSSYDRVLDMDRAMEEVVLYTLNNPVRKGLVTEWREWPYSRMIDAL